MLQLDYRNSMPASSYQQQKLRVCEVCSAYLGIHDNDRRLADHFGGKLHLGFIEIREKLANLTVSCHHWARDFQSKKKNCSMTKWKIEELISRSMPTLPVTHVVHRTSGPDLNRSANKPMIAL